MYSRDFRGDPVAKDSTLPMQGPRYDPWSGNYISHASTKSSYASTKDSSCCKGEDWRSHMPQLRPNAAKIIYFFKRSFSFKSEMQFNRKMTVLVIRTAIQAPVQPLIHEKPWVTHRFLCREGMMIFPPKHLSSDLGGRNESIHTAVLTKLSTPTVSYKSYVGAMKALCF